MKSRPNILWIIPILACTMCASFPVILNLGGSSPANIDQGKAFAIANWNTPVTEPQDPENIWLAEVVWVLQEIHDIPVPDTGRDIWIQFNASGNAIRGQSPCNGFSAPYTLDNTTFHIGPIQSTRIYCKGEKDLFDGLRTATGCMIQDTNLIFFSGDSETLQFTSGVNFFRGTNFYMQRDGRADAASGSEQKE